MDTSDYLESKASAVMLPKILLVDDEGDILRSLRRLLRKKFAITATTQPEDALQHLADDDYAVLLSDQRMPTMEGTELMLKAREVSPETVRIILTGYADLNAVMDAINQGGVYRFLQKPWNDADLLATLGQAADYYALIQENKRLHALTEAQNEQLKAFNRGMQTRVVERTRQITQLNEDLTSTLQGMTGVLARLADRHSPALGSHAKRVARLARAVGQYMGLSDESLYQLEVAATLHDIGKIGMDAKLLCKHPAGLSPEEEAVLVTHAVTGAALVRKIPHLEEAARNVRHHHERFDGKGFPDRLFGRQIPVGARIIAAADAYDNAINNRVSFRFATSSKAPEYLEECAGHGLDSEVVGVLKTILQDHTVEEEEIEVEMDIRDLEPGMVLSQHVYNEKGKLMMPRETKLDEVKLFQLLKYHQTNPIKSIYVHRS